MLMTSWSFQESWDCRPHSRLFNTISRVILPTNKVSFARLNYIHGVPQVHAGEQKIL